MVKPQRWPPPNDMGKAGSDPENAGISITMEALVNVTFSLNMCGDTDLSGAGFCKSGSEV